MPAADVKLSPAERRKLRDPEWIDQEEAEVLLIARAVAEEGTRGMPLREYMRRRGVRLER